MENEDMLLLKGCPRCRGDLLLVRYYDEHTLSCLQCGYVRSLVPSPGRKTSLADGAVPARRPPRSRPRGRSA